MKMFPVSFGMLMVTVNYAFNQLMSHILQIADIQEKKYKKEKG